MVAPTEWDRHRAGHEAPPPLAPPTEGELARAYEQYQRPIRPEEG